MRNSASCAFDYYSIDQRTSHTSAMVLQSLNSPSPIDRQLVKHIRLKTIAVVMAATRRASCLRWPRAPESGPASCSPARSPALLPTHSRSGLILAWTAATGARRIDSSMR